LKTFDDLKGTPGKLEFFVYFEPGVSGLSPESLRYSGGGDTHPIWISRFGFGDEVLRDVRVRLMDEASQVIYVTDQVEKVAGGASLKIIVPDDALRNTLGRVRVSVWMRGKWKAVPEALTVVGRVGIDRIEPTSGYGGQSAVIYGKHIRPFRIANEVLFYRKKREGAPLKAVVRQITRREIHITIPEGVALGKEEEWEVVVIEKAGGHTRRSKTLAFTSKGERWVKVREKIRAGRMPEKSWVIQGRVDQKKRVARHNFTIPAGMELDLKLTDLTGSADNPDRVSLNEFKLWLQVRNDEGKLEWKNVHSAHHLERRNFRRRFVHATAGDLHLARYQLAVSLWYSEEANYKIELKTTARDDNGTGLDAPSDWKRALEFPVGEVVKGYLFGAPEKGGEDYADWWQVLNVPAGVEFRFELGNLKAFHRGYFKVAPQLGLVEIWRLTVDEAGRKTMKRLTDKYQFSQIESRDLPVIFRHREDQVCSYLVCVHHNLAYLQYWMKAELR